MVLFVGCLMLGLGLGFLFDQLPAGLFIGLGVGFIVEGAVDRATKASHAGRGRGRSENDRT